MSGAVDVEDFGELEKFDYLALKGFDPAALRIAMISMGTNSASWALALGFREVSINWVLNGAYSSPYSTYIPLNPIKSTILYLYCIY